MAVLGMLLMLVGGIVSLIGGVMLLIEAFKVSVLWGLGSLFIPFVVLVFAIKYWDEAKTGFLLNIAGTFGCIIAMVLMAMGEVVPGSWTVR